MDGLEGQRGWWWHPRLHAGLKQTSHTGARRRVQLRRRPRRVQASDELPSIHSVAAQLRRCASCRSAWCGSSDAHGATAPPGVASTPTDGLLRSATSSGRPTQLLLSWRRRSTSSERKKNQRPSLHRGKTKKPTAHKQVLYRQPCCLGRNVRAAGTRTHPAAPPAGPNAAEKDPGPPRQTSSSSSTAAVDPKGRAASPGAPGALS